MKNEKEIIIDIAARVGVSIDDHNPWDIQVHNEDFYPRVMRQIHLGLGESYMDGWWDCERLDEFFFKVLRADLDKELRNWRIGAHFLKARIVNYANKVQIARRRAKTLRCRQRSLCADAR